MIQALLDEIARDVPAVAASGKVASYIPALANVERDRFGIAYASIEGALYGSGDFERLFSIQSVSKVFALALALASDGDRLWSRVGREPSGNPFNSLVQLERENGIPRNPFINAGALVVVDRLLALRGNAAEAVCALLRAESGNAGVDIDRVVAESELASSRARIATRRSPIMASFKNLDHPVETVLDHYCRLCAIAMSCADLARAGLFLARHGVRADGGALLSQSDAKRINAVMLTCGAASELAPKRHLVTMLPVEALRLRGLLAMLSVEPTSIKAERAVSTLGHETKPALSTSVNTTIPEFARRLGTGLELLVEVGDLLQA